MHSNSIVDCPGCMKKINKYPNFYAPMLQWFLSMRKNNQTFHLADAGRGRVDQEVDFARGASKAHYGQSSHNYNCALDTFFQIDGKYCLDRNLFDAIVEGLDPNISWYGSPNADFKELPHFEWKNWLQLKESGDIKLVE